MDRMEMWTAWWFIKAEAARRCALWLMLALVTFGGAQAENRVSATDLVLAKQDVGSVTAGRDLNFANIRAKGMLTSGRHVQCTRCEILGSVTAGGDVRLKGGQAAEVTAGHDLFLEESAIDQSARVGNRLSARNSQVRGEVTIGGSQACLQHTHTGKIRFSPRVASHFSRVHSAGQAQVSLGAHSLTATNGYVIKSDQGNTMLITPEQWVYQNGRKVSGEGPADYQGYRAGHADAPHVRGPGWPECLPKNTGTAPRREARAQAPVHTLELLNQSVVDGDVVFERDAGQVLLQAGSRLNGRVHNGVIKKIP